MLTFYPLTAMKKHFSRLDSFCADTVKTFDKNFFFFHCTLRFVIQGKKYMQNQKHSPLKIYHSCVDVRSGVSKRSGRPVLLFLLLKKIGFGP